MTLCTSDHLPSSVPAQGVRAVILELVDALDIDPTCEPRRANR